MKAKLILSVVFILILQIQLYAQNVGINDDGSTPDNSAMLHVKSANKGLLIPQIALTGVNDAASIPSPATSLLVYNTTDGSGLTPGYYYNSGTPASPVWKALTTAGGLTNFTESNYLYNTKYGVKLLSNNAATDVDFVLSPKGNGSILAQQPDGTTAGGNIRGLKAVDLQMLRNSVSMVASGNYSVTIGSYNTASAANSTAIGYANTASSASSVAIGNINTASGQYSAAIGYANAASGDKSVASGISNTAQSFGETVLGIKATTGAGDPNSFVSTDRLFVIGNGTVSKSDALYILKNGNTTIGGSLTLNGNGSGTSYNFPINRGTNGQVLQTDGAGTTSWISPAGGTVTGVTGTAPIVSSGGNTPAISISAATTSTAGSMSATDKTKLNAQTTGTAIGQMQYWNGTAWVTVATGLAGQLLTVNPSGIPEWQNPSSIKTAYTINPTMTSEGVIFHGVINPNGLFSFEAFEYGTTTSYGNTASTTVYGPGTENHTVESDIISGLTVGSTYHVRLIAQNIFGTFYCNDIAFTYAY
ncbi:MAG: hypothetical protein WCM93_06965 [Bacteroidota bacterium]